MQQRNVTQKHTMQNTNAHATSITQTVYTFLLHSSNKRTAASIASNTQLTTAQVCSALQNLQKRNLVTSSKQAHKRSVYAVAQQVTQAQQINKAAQQQTHTKLTIMQLIKRLFA